MILLYIGYHSIPKSSTTQMLLGTLAFLAFVLQSRVSSWVKEADNRLQTQPSRCCLCLGGCQNYGPLLGTLNIRCRIIIGIHKGTIILTTTRLGLGDGISQPEMCSDRLRLPEGTMMS